MYRRKIKKGLPYTFHEFIFFSPRQFEEPVPVEEKDFIYRLKICTNSNRCFTGPFYDEVIGEYELSKKEINKVLEMIEKIPGVIIMSTEYTITDDYNGLWKYYGDPSNVPLANVKREELMAQ